MSRFERLGRWVVRRRWLVVATWAVILLGAVPLATRTSGALRSGGFVLDSLESARAKALLESEIGVPPAAVVVVFHSETALAGTPSFEIAAAAAVRDLPSAPYVSGGLSHLLAPRQVSADRRTAYDVVFLDLGPDDSPAALPGIRERLHQVSPLEVGLAGGPAFYGDVQDVSESDLRRSEIISLPLAGLALLFVFGSVVAAALPLAVGGTAVVVALAGVFIAASVIPMSIFVLNLATLLGLGLGVDYSLLMTSRFREELAARGGASEAVADAVGTTVATAGRAVFFSGVTVLLGLVGLILFDFMILRSVGIAGAIVVGLAVGAALTLLPALLAIIGPRLDALRVRRIQPSVSGTGAWSSLAWRVMDRPVAILLPTLAVLLLLGSPFLHVRFNAPDSTILPANVPSRLAFDRLAAAFGEGPFAPIVLAIRTTGPATEPRNVAALYDYSRRLAADPRVVRVDSVVNGDPRLSLAQYQLLYASPGGPPDRFTQEALAATTKGDLTAFTIITPFGPNNAHGRELARDLRAATGPLAAPGGMSMLVGGGAADVEDVVAGVAAEFPRSGLFILVSTYVVLFILLRSAILPLKALLMNSLSITASFGALVWIFQDGNLSKLLGTTPLGFVETTQPVILFCVLFGLSMDYEVFLLSRMQETWHETSDNREAVARGLERSGRIITSAALIVVLVAGSFAFADIVLVKALGLGIAIAVALDATVVRALLVPATMRLLGRWNWWAPAAMLRRIPAIVSGVVPLALVGLVLAGCGGGPVLANPPVDRGVVATPAPTPTPADDPQPIAFPRDDAPHHRLTEWWYYTGHLRDEAGGRWGFEFVVFRAERGGFPVTWASHLALTDEAAGSFTYGQRSEIGPQVDASLPGAGTFSFAIRGASPLDPAWAGRSPWVMSNAARSDRLVATLESGDGIDLNLLPTKPPALHDGDGWIDFGPAGGSYYYSRTRMTAAGSLIVDGGALPVEGIAWFDHQWGDFISVGGGGWDWFAVNLDDGTDLTLSLVRAADGSYPIVYGTIVDAPGTARHLARDAFTVASRGTWHSARTGATYPAGWAISLPAEGLEIALEPTVANQELDTRATTGVVYWEGSQTVQASRHGTSLGGEAYVELTGYAAAGG